MGSTLSILKFSLQIFTQTLRSYRALGQKIKESPGLPLPNPTNAIWMVPPAEVPVEKEWPDTQVDVVIIGSGITGVSFARELMKENKEARQSKSAVMLEARDVCSGATGRNGGHITPPLYHAYAALKSQFGARTAQEIIQFRLSHLPELLKVAREEGLGSDSDSQCREVDTYDVFWDTGLFEDMQCRLKEYLSEIPSEQRELWIREGKWRVIWQGTDEMKELGLAKDVVGAIWTRAGAVHPYRLVTGILKRLVKEGLRVYTQAPVTSIRRCSTNSGLWVVETPKGIIRCRNVIHCTNGWSAHLVPSLRGVVVPTRGHMTAQLQVAVPTTLPAPLTPNPNRSFVFYPSTSEDRGYDYLTTLPTGEMMFGGGFFSREDNLFEDLGNTDDGKENAYVRAYLRGVFGTYFNFDEGKSAAVPLSSWTGVLGSSADRAPWVGQLPGEDMTGQWISAGYTGEGMTHAWLCGKGLANLVLGYPWSETGVPECFRITKERIEKADFGKILD